MSTEYFSPECHQATAQISSLEQFKHCTLPSTSVKLQSGVAPTLSPQSEPNETAVLPLSWPLAVGESGLAPPAIYRKRVSVLN